MLDKLVQLWRAMAQAIDSNASREIEILSILDIPQVASFAFYKHERWSDISLHHVRCLLVDESCS